MKKSARTNTRSLSNTNAQPMENTMKKSARTNTRTLSRNSVTSKAPKASAKTPRSYEREDLTGNFMKSFVASPKSEAASAFYAECRDLLDMVWPELPENGIYNDLWDITEKVAHDPDYDPFKALCTLIDTYDLSARQIRVVLQLISPIVTVCCDLTDRLARYLGMSCANRLMGSACNELQCEKCGDFSQGIPFVRVCYNATRLGFVKGDTDSIDIDALVECIRYWLDPKEDNEPKKAAPKAALNAAAKDAPKDEPMGLDTLTAAIQAAIQAAFKR